MAYKAKPKLEWNDPDIQIVPSRERKKVYRPTVDKIEKRQKDTIRRLRNRIVDKYHDVAKARKQRDKVKASRKLHTKKAVTRSVIHERFRARKYISRMWERKWEFANTIIKNRVKKVILNNSKYLNGISSFPIIYSWCKEFKIDPTTFGLFVLINHYEWFTPADGLFFGHSKPVTSRHIRKLIERGLVEDMRSSKVAYVSSVLGKSTFRKFKKYHDERMNELMENFEKAFSEKDDPLELRKYKKLKKLTDADKQENTEQEQGS